MYKVREEREYISQLNCEQLRYFFIYTTYIPYVECLKTKIVHEGRGRDESNRFCVSDWMSVSVH